jgi:hypothetical protein
VRRQHDTNSPDCWCKPDLFVICDGCDGSPEGCWHCASSDYKGLVPSLWDEDDGEPLIIAHNDV